MLSIFIFLLGSLILPMNSTLLVSRLSNKNHRKDSHTLGRGVLGK
uniref:Uncharacterized protein n=1 Tax=Anguilla anguilla TaxID=7936 RepID=A0A0E9Q6R7_ANGAN